MNKLLIKIISCILSLTIIVTYGSNSLAYNDSYSSNPKEDVEYTIYVNKLLNTVTVYRISEEGQEIPYKVMLCSCGRAGHGTPAGSFKTTDYYTWRLMVDNTYAQYAVRFNNKILFHSVPYLKDSKDTLEWDQFNLLGQNASLGCVRLAVNDCKWIYDNCKPGTKVVVYEDEENPGALGKPEGFSISENSPNRDWDPTDESADNPWKNDPEYHLYNKFKSLESRLSIF